MIWRGDMPYFLSSGGGGKSHISSCRSSESNVDKGRWLRLTYELGPTIIDLT